MTKTYNITREIAAKTLWVSTRTIDRYVKSWKLSYKKIANKVLLAREEVSALQQEFSALRQEVNTEIIGAGNTASNPVMLSSIEESIDEKVDKFFLIFKEKDKMIEEKNKVIFMLQQKLSEVEAKLQHMIALPDYNKEKQMMISEKKDLEDKVKKLSGTVTQEKTKNMIFIWIALIFMVLAAFLLIKS